MGSSTQVPSSGIELKTFNLSHFGILEPNFINWREVVELTTAGSTTSQVLTGSNPESPIQRLKILNKPSLKSADANIFVDNSKQSSHFISLYKDEPGSRRDKLRLHL